MPYASHLLALLAISLQLPEGTLTDTFVHSLVLIQDNRVHGTGESAESPVHDAVGPVGSASVSDTLSTTRASNLTQRSSDELLGVGDGSAGTLDLGHCRGDQVRLNKLNVNSVGLHFGTQSTAPLLKEGFAARVGGQEGSRENAAEGSHGENETTATLNHTGCNDLSDAESAHAVDGDDVLELLFRGLDERNRHLVAETDIVDENGDLQIRNQSLQGSKVRVLVLGEVHSKSLGLNRAVLGLDFRGQSLELRLCARDQDDVETLCCKLQGIFLADTIGSTGDNSPATFTTELGELVTVSILLSKKDMECLTEVPGKMNRLAINLQKLKIFRVMKRRPMAAKTAVTGSLRGSSISAVISGLETFFSCLSMAKAVLLSLRDHTLEKVPARMSAIQGPISYEPTIVRQATSPVQNTPCCQIPPTQINRLSMNSVLEYLPAGEGLLPKWIFFVRLQRVNNGSTRFLTMFRSRSYRSVTAFKPICPSVPHKRCTVVLNRSPLAYLPTPSPAHHPSHLCQLAPSVPGPQSLLSSVYMPPTTSQPSPCTSWLSGHTLSHSHISCPSG